MCVNCWEDYGSPSDWNHDVDRALTLIRTIYATESAGGLLHAALDDWNLDGEITAADSGGEEMDPRAVEATEELVPLLNRMTLGERASALAHHEGYQYATGGYIPSTPGAAPDQIPAMLWNQHHDPGSSERTR